MDNISVSRKGQSIYIYNTFRYTNPHSPDSIPPTQNLPVGPVSTVSSPSSQPQRRRECLGSSVEKGCYRSFHEWILSHLLYAPGHCKGGRGKEREGEGGRGREREGEGGRGREREGEGGRGHAQVKKQSSRCCTTVHQVKAYP